MENLFKRTAAALVVAVAAFAVNAPMTLTAEAATVGGCSDTTHSGYTSLDSGALTAGNLSGEYYLSESLVLNDEITINNNVTICLNGNTITAAGGHRVFDIQGGSLTLCDCKGTGEIKGGDVKEHSGVGGSSGGAVYVDNSGAFILNGGKITGSSAKHGGGVYVNGHGNFEMNGGLITGNIAIHQGGGVYVSGDGNFEMNGGTISENSVIDVNDADKATAGGGGVYMAGSFTISGNGEISQNTSQFYGGGVVVSGSNAQFTLINGTISNNTANTYGGGVHVSSSGTVNMRGGTINRNKTGSGKGGGGVSVSGGTFTMENGSISGNTSTYGGGLYLTAGSFTMTGGAISGNEAKLGSCVYMDADLDRNNPGGTLTLNGKVSITSNTDSNVYLKNTKKITIGSSFSTASPIGIHPETLPVTCQNIVPATEFAENTEPFGLIQYFKADRDPKNIVYVEDEIKLIGVHSYTDTAAWERDPDNHWHECEACGLPAGTAAHRWDNGTITRKPTSAAAGERKYVCLDCKYEKTEPIPYKAPSTGGGNRTPVNDEDNSVAPASTNPPTGIELAIAPAALAFVGLGAALTRKRR